MYAVEIDQLTYTYPGASQPTLREITLRIPQGDFLAVVGNNGCGKSTLCKTLNGLIPHFITGDFAGRVKVGGLDTLEIVGTGGDGSHSINISSTAALPKSVSPFSVS